MKNSEPSSLDTMIKDYEETQNQYLVEAVEELQEEVAKEMQPKLKANYLPNTWRYEEEKVNQIVDYLKTSVSVKVENSTNGRKRYYEEDDLSNYMNDAQIPITIEKSKSPYFARMDFIEDGEKLGKTLYISNYNDVNASTVSWKNPIARLYYGKRLNEKMLIHNKELELERYRNITINNGKLITLHPEQSGFDEVDPFLIETLAKKKGTEMKELVNTLQAEQYELIRLPIEKPIVVQGSAGSGKSVVALHRLSYILFNFKQLQANKIAIIGPNKLFLNHIKKVLPELGEQNIVQTTMQQYLEELIPMSGNIQEVERMILSEIKDLSVKEGREEKLKEFEAYSNIRKIKGNLKYKDYIEQYTNYITANLAPFIRTFSLGDFSVSGIELATFFNKETHFGNSKDKVKKFISKQMKDKNNTVLQIYREIAVLIEQEVKHYFQMLRDNNLLHLSHPVIDAQLQQVRDLNATYTNIKTHLEDKNYSPLLNLEELHEMMLIQNDKKKEQEMNKLIAEKSNEAKFQLNEAKNKLKRMLQQFIKLKVTEMQENLTEIFTIRKQMQHKLVALLNSYCELFQKQYRLEQTSQLLEIETYITIEEMEQQILEVNEKYLVNIEAGWAEKKEELIKQLQQKIEDEIASCFVGQLEQLLIHQFEEVVAYDISIKSEYHSKSKLTEDQPLVFDELYKELNTLYNTSADNIYKAIIMDKYSYGEKIKKHWDHTNLKEYPIIGKHDLPALYVIHKLITPVFKKPFQYIIVDEAQDYTQFEMYVVKDLTQQIMLMGDLGQNLTPSNNLYSWQKFREVIGEFQYYELKATYRSTKQIVEFSNNIIRDYSEGRYKLPLITFRNGEPIHKVLRSGAAIYQSILELVNKLIEEDSKESKIAIITSTVREAKYLYDELNHPSVDLQIGSEFKDSKVIIITPVYAKGLEFDTVILFRFSRFNTNDEHESKLAYVAASRALHKLYVYV